MAVRDISIIKASIVKNQRNYIGSEISTVGSISRYYVT